MSHITVTPSFKRANYIRTRLKFVELHTHNTHMDDSTVTPLLQSNLTTYNFLVCSSIDFMNDYGGWQCQKLRITKSYEKFYKIIPSKIKSIPKKSNPHYDRKDYSKWLIHGNINRSLLVTCPCMSKATKCYCKQCLENKQHIKLLQDVTTIGHKWQQ